MISIFLSHFAGYWADVAFVLYCMVVLLSATLIVGLCAFVIVVLQHVFVGE